MNASLWLYLDCWGKSPVEELAAVTGGGGGGGGMEERGRFGKGCKSMVNCHFQLPGWFER